MKSSNKIHDTVKSNTQYKEITKGMMIYRVGQISGTNAVCFVVVKHILENFDNFWQVK